MGEERPLWPAGRPRRVTHERDIVLEQFRRLATRWRGADGILIVPSDLEHQANLGPGRVAVVDQRHRTRIGQYVLDLVGGQTEVDRDGDGAASMTSEQRLDELDPVVEKQRDPIARLDAACVEDRGEACGAIVKLGVGADLLAEHDGGMVRAGSARSARELRQNELA